MKNRLTAIWRLIWANEFYLVTVWGVNGQWIDDSKENKNSINLIRELNKRTQSLREEVK